MCRARRFSSGTIADRDIQVAVIRMAGLRRRIEAQITQWVDVAGKPDPEDFARGPLERGVAVVGVDPLDEHGMTHDRARGRIDNRGGGIPKA